VLTFDLPTEAKEITSNIKWPALAEWLKKRKFTTDDCNFWGAKYIDSGYYNSRLLLPIRDVNLKMVGFQAKDVTGEAKISYDQPKGFKIKNNLYGLWRTSNKAIVVEGILDVWRGGVGCVASFGKALSDAQRKLLYDKAKKIVLVWDSDAWIEAQREKRWWEGVGKNIKIVRLPAGHDPDSFIITHGKEAWNELIGD